MTEIRRASARIAALVAAVGLVVAPLALAGQDDKVSIRPRPGPNQTIHVSMTQDMQMELTVVGMPAGAPIPQGPMKSVGKTVFEGTQIVGSPDAEGRLSSELTFDQATANMTMNGNAMPAQQALDRLIGKKFTVVFDAQGKVVDFKVPDELTAFAPTLKETMTSMMGGLPAVALGVGEAVSVPLNLTLPIPMPGAVPMNMTGQQTFTLLSVGRVGSERIATFGQKMDAKMAQSMDIPGSNGSATMTLDFKTAGNGTTQWNLDRGYVMSSDMTSTVDGATTGPFGVTIHGTIRIVTEGSAVR